LRLRGNREFEDVDAYREFVQSVVAQRNAKRTAKHEGLDTVDEILQSLLTSGGEMTAAAVLALIASGQQLPSPLDMNIDPPDLNEFDDLLSDKDAYNDQEAIDLSSQLAPDATSEEGYETRLDDYDDDLGLTSTIEGSTSTDDPRDAHSGGVH